LLEHRAFSLPVELLLDQPMSFLTYTLPVLSPIPLGGGVSEWLSGAELPAVVKPRHHYKWEKV